MPAVCKIFEKIEVVKKRCLAFFGCVFLFVFQERAGMPVVQWKGTLLCIMSDLYARANGTDEPRGFRAMRNATVPLVPHPNGSSYDTHDDLKHLAPKVWKVKQGKATDEELQSSNITYDTFEGTRHV